MIYINSSIDENKIKEVDRKKLYVRYEPDMFLRAYYTIGKYGMAIAVDDAENEICALEYLETLYRHEYKYSGGVDLSFLNSYDCLFLFDCNEFSVELCRSALNFWSGKRLVLLGKNWEQMVPLLPDLPGKECFYEPQLTNEQMQSMHDGMKALLVSYGIPHYEPLQRFWNNVMYYDEVMAFTFLFSNELHLGELNDDKCFFVLDANYANVGLFVLEQKSKCVANYAKSKGMIPVMHLKSMPKNIYQDESGEEVWDKFFCQPEGYGWNEVSQSAHVFYSPMFYNGSVMEHIMNQASVGTTLSWPDGYYNQRVKSAIADAMKQFLPYPEKTLGVLARGTDYVHAHLSNHPIHASIEMLCEKIDECMKEWEDLEYIYVSTEDASYADYLKERYGSRITFTNQHRYTVRENETLSNMHRRSAENVDGYTLGEEYIISIALLAQCRDFLASGSCGGVNAAKEQNNGRYRHEYIFNLGNNAEL
jgi:hypothetical protein